MNIEKLKKLESEFLSRHPEGFKSPEFKKTLKKHNVEKQTIYINEVLTEDYLKKGSRVFKEVSKVVSSSSLVSVFEKMRFRDMCADFTNSEKRRFVEGVSDLLYGHEKSGFYTLYALLKEHRLAKWPIISVYRVYAYPKKDVFMKPTVVKKVIAHLDLNMKYESDPSYTLYKKYRTAINKMKKEVDLSLRPNNLAFTGFLMLTI